MSMLFSFLFKRWREILILILVGVILFISDFGKDYGDREIVNVDGKNYELLEQKIDTVVVEKEVKVKEYVPKYITRIETDTIEIPQDIDSLAVIEDYYSRYKSVDTLQLSYDFPDEVTDENGNEPQGYLGYGVLTDIISQNKIQSREVDWFFKIPTVYNTSIVKELPKNELYYGLGAGLSADTYTLSGGILLKTKKSKIFGISAGIANQVTDTQLNITEFKPYIGAQLYWKLGKK